MKNSQANKLKFTIITAVHNNESITDAINSVLSQDYDNVEYIVVDGASTDGTSNIIQTYGDKIDLHICEKDGGIYHALNKGISYATGDVIVFLHSDDFFSDNTVLTKAAYAFENTDIDATYGDLTYVSINNTRKKIRSWKSGSFSQAKLAFGWMPPHPTFFVRKNIYNRFGVFDTQFKISADYDIILRFLGQYKIRVHYIPQELIKMRTGGISNNSVCNIALKTSEDYKALKKNKIGSIHTLLFKNLIKLPQFIIK